MYLVIKKAKLVKGNREGKGKNIEISMVQLLDDDGKHIKFTKLNQAVIDSIVGQKISIDIKKTADKAFKNKREERLSLYGEQTCTQCNASKLDHHHDECYQCAIKQGHYTITGYDDDFPGHEEAEEGKSRMGRKYCYHCLKSTTKGRNECQECIDEKGYYSRGGYNGLQLSVSDDEITGVQNLIDSHKKILPN